MKSYHKWLCDASPKSAVRKLENGRINFLVQSLLDYSDSVPRKLGTFAEQKAQKTFSLPLSPLRAAVQYVNLKHMRNR